MWWLGLPAVLALFPALGFALARLLWLPDARRILAFLFERVAKLDDPVQIIDPINASNNVARLYTAENADDIVEAALDAGDAIDSALAAPNKELTVYYWQKVFGPSFQG